MASASASPHLAALERGYMPPSGVRDLVPAQPHLLITIEDLLSEFECKRLIATAHATGLQPPSAADLTPRKNEAFLNRESASFVDAEFSGVLWRRLRPLLPDIDGGRTPLGLYADSNKREAGKFKRVPMAIESRAVRPATCTHP